MRIPPWLRPSVARVLLTSAILVLASGLPLLAAYQPEPEQAHGSVAAIDEGPLGLVRAAHSWAATLLLGSLIVVACRAWIAAGPDVLVASRWSALVAVGFLAAGAFLTGRILTWDQHAWESFLHADTVLAWLGRPGWVGDEPSQAPLGDVFWLHVLALPAAALAFAAILARLRGTPTAASARALAIHTVTDAPTLVVVLGASAFFAPNLGPAPIPGLYVSKPDWPFLWLDPSQNWFGAAALPAALVAFAALVFAQPWLVPRLTPRLRGIAFLVWAATMLALSVLGARR